MSRKYFITLQTAGLLVNLILYVTAGKPAITDRANQDLVAVLSLPPNVAHTTLTEWTVYPHNSRLSATFNSRPEVVGASCHPASLFSVLLESVATPALW